MDQQEILQWVTTLGVGALAVELIRGWFQRKKISADYVDTLASAANILVEPLAKRVERLESALSSAEARNWQLSSDLSAAEQQGRTLKADLIMAQDQIRDLNRDLVTAKDQIIALQAQLENRKV